MNLFNSKELNFLKILILLFQFIFIFLLLFNYDIIIVVNPFFKHISEEYWIWFADERSGVKHEAFILMVSYVIKWLFSASFLLGGIKILFESAYRSQIGTRRILLCISTGGIAYIVSFVLIKYFAIHYRLYMTFISTEILSLLLGCLIIFLKKNSNQRKMEGKTMVRIRPYKSSDAPYLLNWLADERTVAFWKADRFSWPLTMAQLDKYRADFETDPQSCIFTALDGEGDVVGHFSFRNIDYRENTAHLGFIVTDPAARGQGLGRQMVSLALSCAFTMLKVGRVTLGVFDCNLPAIRCYEASGFTCVKQDSVFIDFHGERWKYFYMEKKSEG